MANYQLLKADIDEKVYQNGHQEITGINLNSVLNQMVTTLGEGYQFAGVATKDTNPEVSDAKVFYIANGKGTYTNFGSLEVTEDDVVVLYWDSSWHKVSTGIASNEKLSELEKEVIYDVTANNNNAVFESLQALLSSSNLGTLIPISVRHGGMSIRFIQGSVPNSDNKYVQYFLTKNEWSASEGDWEKMNLEEIVAQHIMETHTYDVVTGTAKTVRGIGTLVNGKQYQLVFKQGANLITKMVIWNLSYGTYVAVPINSTKVGFTANFDGGFDLVINNTDVVGTGTLEYDIVDNPQNLGNKVEELDGKINELEDVAEVLETNIENLQTEKAKAVKSVNLLNPDTLYIGHFYWRYGNETAIGDNANYAITDYIPINGHNIKANWNISGGMANCVFNANKQFLRKIESNDYTYQNGDAYIKYTTYSNPENSQCQLEYGDVSTPYEPYTDKYDVYQLSKEYTDQEIGKINNIDIIVKKDGTGDYTKVIDAVEYANNLSNDGVVRNIHIYEGKYDILDELGGQTWLDAHTTLSGYAGLFPKNNVNLIGHGLVILKTILPTTINESQGTAISALTLSHYNNRIENLIVIGQNTRYACHDESDGNGAEVIRVVKNCTFILLPKTAEHAWQYQTCYGGGTTSGGGTYDFVDCRFMSSVGNAWSFHTNAGAKPMYFNVDGCFGYCSGDLSFRFSYYSTGQDTTFVNIKNCTGNGGVEKRAETVESTDHIILFNNGYQSITSQDAIAIYDQIINSID